MDNNSVARVYQFLSKNYTSLNDWKQEVDEAGYGKNDGILTKYEVRKYLENEFALDSNFFNEKDDNIDDIVNRFWASIDTKTTGNVGLTGVSNKNALDNDEIAKMELGLQAADRVSTFMLTKQNEINALNLEKKGECYESIKSGVLNKLLNRIKESGNITSLDSIDDSVLEGFYKTVSKTAVADYAASETINKELQNVDYDNDDYKIDDDKTWQKIRDTFVRGFINDDSSVTLDAIINGAKDLAAAYADTAKRNSQESVDKLGSTYNTHKLNDLQVAVLTKSIKDAINNRLENKEIYKLFGSEIDAKIPAFISNKLNKKTASEFVSLKGQVGTWAGEFETNELSDINTKYTQFKEKRDNLKTFVNEELSKEDNKTDREAAAQTAFGTSVLNDITKDEGKIDKMNVAELEKADTDFRAAIAAIGALNPNPESDDDPNQKLKSAFGDASKVVFSDQATMSLNKEEIHTEFAINSSGKIIFEQSDTTAVYEQTKAKILEQIENQFKDAYTTIGKDKIEILIQTAWIMAYNDFNSSESNNTIQFITKVTDNLKNIFAKLSTNPEYLTVFTDGTAYSDKDLVKDLVMRLPSKTLPTGQQIQLQQKWEYGFEEKNGEIHLEDETSDECYQETMNALLNKILTNTRYSGIDENTLKTVFKNAQKKALECACGNIKDCPFGTTYGCQFEELSELDDAVANQDWDGTGRHGDRFKITPLALVELTLYFFDKLLYAELVK